MSVLLIVIGFIIAGSFMSVALNPFVWFQLAMTAALNVAAWTEGRPEVGFPEDTAIGALVRYVTTPQRGFAPMNATWGIFPAANPMTTCRPSGASDRSAGSK